MKKEINCKNHGVTKSIIVKNKELCTKCLALSMYPLSTTCPIHHEELEITHANTGYCHDCAKHYNLCKEKFGNFKCISIKNHDGPHLTSHGFEWMDTDIDIKMEFSGPFRRAK